MLFNETFLINFKHCAYAYYLDRQFKLTQLANSNVA